MSSALAHQNAVHLNELSSAVSLSSAGGQAAITGLSQRMAALGVADPGGAARKAYSYLLIRDAEVLSFGDAFALLATACLCAAALTILLRPTRAAAAPPPNSH
jgi:DHA2 family multidrug resistance protein